MPRIFNRITLSLVIIVLLIVTWEFLVKPETSPLYTEAVAQYKNTNYDRSLQLLQSAYNIDPNDTATLTLMGWNYLKKGEPQRAEPYFARAHRLAPHVMDLLLGYAYTEIALKKYERAAELLNVLKKNKVDTPDVHVAWATLYREVGRNQEAAREFQLALALDSHNEVAAKNLREILNVKGDLTGINLSFQPIVRPNTLTYTARVVGSHLEWQQSGSWKPVYLKGVSLTAALPGQYPITSTMDPAVYEEWFRQMSALGVNTIHVYSIMPPAFYRTLYQYNHAAGNSPLRVLQGVVFGDPPQDDLFNHEYYANCQKAIEATVDVLHGQGDVAATYAHPGGLYTNDVSEYVAGIVLGKEWLSHVVTGNNQLHPDMRSYQGTYVQVPTGSATEVFLAQMINYAAEFEQKKYNWQHPIAFQNWPTLDPLHHPTESTILEELSIRRGLGEHVRMPEPPYDDDDSVTVDPTHLRPSNQLEAGYFAAYSVFPYYPDFLDYDPGYLQVRDAEGSNPFLGYLKDLQAHQTGLPLVVTDYGVPSSLGVGHFNNAGFDQGGKTEKQQGQILARLTRSVYDSGAAGGCVFEWLDEWFRQTWLVRNFETPTDHKPLWTNFMDPAEYSGLVAGDPQRKAAHLLSGDPTEWQEKPPVYSEVQASQFQAAGDRYDPARHLKTLYADADEGFLYLRLGVEKLDNDGDGKPDWGHVNYLIGVSTLPNKAGLTSLPFIAPVRFPMGMTYAIQIAGPETSHVWIASAYNPYQLVPVEGIPSQRVLQLKLGWNAEIADKGTFDPQIIEPNRRRYGRNGKYFPVRQYDRGLLQYGSLDPKSPDYNSLAEFHGNVRSNTIDLRIPWALLGVTDPSSLRVFTGLESDGTVKTAETPGFLMAVFSYTPSASDRPGTMMEQGHAINGALPGMIGPVTVLSAAYKPYLWPGWDTPQYTMRTKDSYGLLQKAFQTLPAGPEGSKELSRKVAQNSPPNRRDEAFLRTPRRR